MEIDLLTLSQDPRWDRTLRTTDIKTKHLLTYKNRLSTYISTLFRGLRWRTKAIRFR